MTAPPCDCCGGPTRVEDDSDAYGQVTWSCAAPGCSGAGVTGPSDWSILADEQGEARW